MESVRANQLRSSGVLRGVTILAVAVALNVVAGRSAAAYPEFQEFAEKNSGRPVNCAMCHANADGPVGDGEGQIGSLDEEQMQRLNKARAALEPGADVDSPILNDFGNQIIKTLGKSKVLESRKEPQALADALGNESDLDGDGIPDAREYLDGTDPLNQFHGEPWRLFVNNLGRFKVDLVLAIVAVGLTVFGLTRLIKGLEILSSRKARERS